MLSQAQTPNCDTGLRYRRLSNGNNKYIKRNIVAFDDVKNYGKCGK